MAGQGIHAQGKFSFGDKTAKLVLLSSFFPLLLLPTTLKSNTALGNEKKEKQIHFDPKWAGPVWANI